MDLVPDSVVDENKLLQLAYPFYESFKGIFVGLTPSVECRVSTRNTLMKLHDTVIFVVIGHELGFLYEALHTKVAVIRRKFSFVVRFICSSFIVVSSALLFFSVKKSSNKFDIGLTYALLIGAMVLDYVSFIQLISSDWPVAALKGIDCLRKIFPAVTCHPRQRWSESMSQYDLISYCLKDDERPVWLYKLADFLHAREILNKIQILLFSSSVNVTLEKVTLILDWLREKFPTELPVNSEARPIRRRRYSTGVFTSEYLRAYKKKELSFRIYREPLLGFESRETEWAELFLRTHLVIEMFFFLTFKKGDERLLKAIMNLKHLSNYAFSLILTQPGMISSMLGDAWNEIFRDTCDELKRFFLENKIADYYEACKKLLQKYCSYSEHPSALAVTRSGSKSVLADACEEAVSLFDDVGAEESLRDFVILFLLRASRSCTPMVHAEQLSKGGEFLTFIWLLQTHFGIIPGAQDIVAGVRRRD
ncbi:hypothetical protein TorRG33x02_125400 [Trema orientale]|nr:hypothetical protein TorRG33x02_125400 [Trema orientale]